MALKAIIALISSILVLDLFVLANAGKEVKMGKSVLEASFVSSGSDWSKDLDGIKPYGPGRLRKVLTYRPNLAMKPTARSGLN